MTEKLISLFNNAHAEGVSLYGDPIIGYFFKHDKDDKFAKELKEICDQCGEDSFNFEEAISGSDIALEPYYNQNAFQ